VNNIFTWWCIHSDSATVVIDDPLPPVWAISTPAPGSKQFDWVAWRVALLQGGAKSAVSDCLILVYGLGILKIKLLFTVALHEMQDCLFCMFLSRVRSDTLSPVKQWSLEGWRQHVDNTSHQVSDVADDSRSLLQTWMLLPFTISCYTVIACYRM